MTAYVNFTKDFPKRCNDLLKAYQIVRWADREVTLLLSVASAGLTMPIERLKERTSPYPFNDRMSYPRAQAAFDTLLSSNFMSANLVSPSHSWYFGSIADITSAPDFWPELQSPTLLPNNKTVKAIVTHIRNALAHGSIHTLEDPISKLVFVASTKHHGSKFDYLMTSPEYFLMFLKNWLTRIENMDFSP